MIKYIRHKLGCREQGLVIGFTRANTIPCGAPDYRLLSTAALFDRGYVA